MAKSSSVPTRTKVNPKFTWNAESVFATLADWEKALEQVAAEVPTIKKFQGHLGDSPAALVTGLQAIEDLAIRLSRVGVYAGMQHNCDATDQAATAMLGKVQSVSGLVRSATAFAEPELLAIGQAKLKEWQTQDARLVPYAMFFDNLFRKQAHVRSEEIEELLGMLGDPFSGPSGSTGMLTDADFKFAPAKSSGGEKLDLTQGTYHGYMGHADRKVRRTAWENYTDKYLEFKNTLANNYASSIKQNVFHMRARQHSSTLAASLFENNIPVEVFHSLINTFKQNLPTWHRYWAIRRKALGLKTLHPYDIWAPFSQKTIKVPYLKAVDWICEGMAPMGKDYVAVMRRGCIEDRWVDVYPNVGKRAGAFSWGVSGTHPFIMMSYNDDLFSLSTLAHELGHSMHSYLTWQHQPLTYSDYSLFVAEVASNFNQVLVRAHLLETQKNRAFQIRVIEEAMSNFHRYFFVMPTLARFELEAHARVERGEGLTADELIDLMADLFSEGYGGEMEVDRARVGITWATFGHLFSDYYVYQYATGISGAHALGNRVLRHEPNAVENYLGFLSAGSALYPLDALQRAGVDLTTPQPVEETFAVMKEYVNRLESLV